MPLEEKASSTKQRTFFAEVSSVVNAAGDTAVLHLVISTDIASIIPAPSGAPEDRGAVTFSVSRTFRDVCQFASDIDCQFSSFLLPVIPSVETSQSSVLRGDEQISTWVKWYLNFLGQVPEVFASEHAVIFFTDTKPYSIAVRDIHGHQAKVDVKGNIWGSVSTESFRNSSLNVLKEAKDLDEKLSSHLHGEKKFPIHDFNRKERTAWLRTEASKLQAHVTAINATTTLLEKHFGERLRKRSEMPPPKNSRQAVGKLAAVSVDHLDIGTRVVGPRGFQGTVMHCDPHGRQGGVVGVCWDDPTAGDCDGTYHGVKKFHCGKTQGSFEKSSNLHLDPAEDETLNALLQFTSDLDAITHQELDRALKHSSTVTGVLSFYSCFLQVASHWVNQLCAFHFTIETAEAWLAAQAQKKSNSVAKELAIEELTTRFSVLWRDIFDEFQALWNGYVVVRGELVGCCVKAIAELLCSMTQSDLIPDVSVCETRQQVVALFRRFHLDS